VGYVIVKKSRHYTGGPGRDGKVYKTAKEAFEVAVKLSQRNPVGFDVLPHKEIRCEVCGGAHVEGVCPDRGKNPRKHSN